MILKKNRMIVYFWKIAFLTFITLQWHKKTTQKPPAVVNYRWTNRQQLTVAGTSGS